MKKYLILVFLLGGCSITKPIVDESKKRELTNTYFNNGCTLSSETVIHNDFLQISMFVEDGTLRFVDGIYNNDFYLDEYENVRFIAGKTNCEGLQQFLVVGDENIYGFSLAFREENYQYTKENFLEEVNSLNINVAGLTIPYDGDAVNVFVCNDLDVLSDCEPFNFYIQKSDNELYLIDFNNLSVDVNRHEVIDFKDYTLLNDSMYLKWMNDKTVNLYSLENELIEVIVDENDEPLICEYVFTYEDKVYFIKKDGSFYHSEVMEMMLTKDELIVENLTLDTTGNLSIKNFSLEMNDGSTLSFDPNNLYILKN